MSQIYFIGVKLHMFRDSPSVPSSGVQDCTYYNRHMSNRYCCLLVSGDVPASKQTTVFVGHACCCMYSL